MDCREVNDNLELFVLGATDRRGAEEISAHLDDCPACRSAEQDCRRLVRAIGPATGRARPEFEDSLRSAVRAEIAAARVRRPRLPLSTAIAAAAAIAACLAIWVSTRPADTPPVEPPTVVRNVPDMWQYSGASAGTASIADGVVVDGASMYLLREEKAGSYVAAIETATGTMLWQSSMPSLGFLAADSSRVFCLSDGDSRALRLTALDAADGEILWCHDRPLPGRFGGLCRPVPIRGDRVCWTNNTDLSMFDANTGKLLWTRTIEGEGPLSAAAFRADGIYIVTSRGIHRMDADSGRESWSSRFDEERRGHGRPGLALSGNAAYFTQQRIGRPSRLFCMNLKTRGITWQKQIGEVRSLLATRRGVFVRGRSVRRYACRTGNLLWSCEAEGCGPLALIGERIYFVDTSRQGRLISLDQRSGDRIWEIPGIRSCDAFARLGETGYIKTQDGVVRAIDLKGLDL